MSPRSAARSGALRVDASGSGTNAAPAIRSARCAKPERGTNGNHSTRGDDGRAAKGRALATARFGTGTRFVDIERLGPQWTKIAPKPFVANANLGPSKRPSWAGRAPAETTCNARLRPGLWSCPPCRAVRRADTWSASWSRRLAPPREAADRVLPLKKTKSGSALALPLPGTRLRAS